MTSPRRAGGLIIRAAAALALTAGALASAAVPASAATPSATGFGSGVVGVPQTITATAICPSGQLTFVATYSNGVQVSSPTVNADTNGSATLTFTPTLAGFITSASIFSTCTPFPTTPSTATISQVSTSTQISTPNTASVGTATKILVTVQSASPSTYHPPARSSCATPTAPCFRRWG